MSPAIIGLASTPPWCSTALVNSTSATFSSDDASRQPQPTHRHRGVGQPQRTQCSAHVATSPRAPSRRGCLPPPAQPPVDATPDHGGRSAPPSIARSDAARRTSAELVEQRTEDGVHLRRVQHRATVEDDVLPGQVARHGPTAGTRPARRPRQRVPDAGHRCARPRSSSAAPRRRPGPRSAACARSPGDTQLTRMSGASSSAAAWVSATTAALAAE